MAALPLGQIPIDYKNDGSLPASTNEDYHYNNKDFKICRITLPQDSTVYRGNSFEDKYIRPTPKYFGSYDVCVDYATKGQAPGTRGVVTSFNMNSTGSFMCIYSDI